MLLRFVLLAARLGGGGDADGDAPFWPMPDRPVRLLQLGDRLVDGALLRLAGRLVVGGDRGLASVTSVPSVAGRASAFCGRGSVLCASVFMSTLSVGEVACFGRRANVFMSALSIGDAACFGCVSAFFGRASVLMHDLPQKAGQVGQALVRDVDTLELALDPGCGLSSFVLVLGSRPVAFVGPAAVEVLCIAVGRIAVGVNP